MNKSNCLFQNSDYYLKKKYSSLLTDYMYLFKNKNASPATKAHCTVPDRVNIKGCHSEY